MKTIPLNKKLTSILKIKARRAKLMTRDELKYLGQWADEQAEGLVDHLTAQELLNLYRVSAEYWTLRSWYYTNRVAFADGYNRAVLPANRLVVKDGKLWLKGHTIPYWLEN